MAPPDHLHGDRRGVPQRPEDDAVTPATAGRSDRLSGIALMTGSAASTQFGAATAPAHRRRGVQTALLSARLADAAAAGCDIAVVTTQPGSKSQQNVQRRGFDLLYTRAVLVREP